MRLTVARRLHARLGSVLFNHFPRRLAIVAVMVARSHPALWCGAGGWSLHVGCGYACAEHSKAHDVERRVGAAGGAVGAEDWHNRHIPRLRSRLTPSSVGACTMLMLFLYILFTLPSSPSTIVVITIHQLVNV